MNAAVRLEKKADAQTRPAGRPAIPADAEDRIIALDDGGAPRPVGKLEAHVRNLRHRAVSIFVFQDGKLLLQQRSATKYHSPHLWANTCCSHPRWAESIDACADRRLREEMGFNVDLTPFGVVEYQAAVGQLFENEVVHRYHGHFGADGPGIDPDPAEVQDFAWMGLDEIIADLAARPRRYAPWFRIYMRDHIETLRGIAGRS
jgi:isopentenyl-diphosphate delta-isomerase